MPEQLIECVPNFSEGQNSDVIDQIIAEIKKASPNISLIWYLLVFIGHYCK